MNIEDFRAEAREIQQRLRAELEEARAERRRAEAEHEYDLIEA